MNILKEYPNQGRQKPLRNCSAETIASLEAFRKWEECRINRARCLDEMHLMRCEDILSLKVEKWKQQCEIYRNQAKDAKEKMRQLHEDREAHNLRLIDSVIGLERSKAQEALRISKLRLGKEKSKSKISFVTDRCQNLSDISNLDQYCKDIFRELLLSKQHLKIARENQEEGQREFDFFVRALNKKLNEADELKQDEGHRSDFNSVFKQKKFTLKEQTRPCKI